MTLYSLRNKIQERKRPITTFYLNIPESERSSFPGPYRARKELEWFEQELRDFELELSSRLSELEKLLENPSGYTKEEWDNTIGMYKLEIEVLLGVLGKKVEVKK